MPENQQTADRNPLINDAIKGHETESVQSRVMQATTVTRAMYANFDPAFERSQRKVNSGDGDLEKSLERASGFGEYQDDMAKTGKFVPRF